MVRLLLSELHLHIVSTLQFPASTGTILKSAPVPPLDLWIDTWLFCAG